MHIPWLVERLWLWLLHEGQRCEFVLLEPPLQLSLLPLWLLLLLLLLPLLLLPGMPHLQQLLVRAGACAALTCRMLLNHERSGPASRLRLQMELGDV